MRKFTILICVVVLYGCSQTWYQRRDIKKLDALSIQQPSEFLRLSNEINPCFHGKAKSDTVFQVGKPDTIYQKGGNVIIHRNDTTFVMVHDTIRITRTNLKTIHDTVPDNRAIAALQAQIKDCSMVQTTVTTQLADEKKSKSTWMWIAVGCIAAITITLVVKIYKFFAGGAVTDVIKNAL